MEKGETGYKVKDIMRKAVITVKKDDTIWEVAKIMEKTGVGSVVVVEDGPVGIITEGDIIKKVVAKGKDAKKIKAKDIMSHPLVTIKPEEDIRKAIEIMRDLDIERLPVVKEGKLVGFISERDITKIEPALIDILSEKVTPESISYAETISGYCELCGKYSNRLKFVNNMWLCEDCRSFYR